MEESVITVDGVSLPSPISKMQTYIVITDPEPLLHGDPVSIPSTGVSVLQVASEEVVTTLSGPTGDGTTGDVQLEEVWADESHREGCQGDESSTGVWQNGDSGVYGEGDQTDEHSTKIWVVDGSAEDSEIIAQSIKVWHAGETEKRGLVSNQSVEVWPSDVDVHGEEDKVNKPFIQEQCQPSLSDIPVCFDSYIIPSSAESASTVMQQELIEEVECTELTQLNKQTKNNTLTFQVQNCTEDIYSEYSSVHSSQDGQKTSEVLRIHSSDMQKEVTSASDVRRPGLSLIASDLLSDWDEIEETSPIPSASTTESLKGEENDHELIVTIPAIKDGITSKGHMLSSSLTLNEKYQMENHCQRSNSYETCDKLLDRVGTKLFQNMGISNIKSDVVESLHCDSNVKVLMKLSTITAGSDVSHSVQSDFEINTQTSFDLLHSSAEKKKMTAVTDSDSQGESSSELVLGKYRLDRACTDFSGTDGELQVRKNDIKVNVESRSDPRMNVSAGNESESGEHCSPDLQVKNRALQVELVKLREEVHSLRKERDLSRTKPVVQHQEVKKEEQGEDEVVEQNVGEDIVEVQEEQRNNTAVSKLNNKTQEVVPGSKETTSTSMDPSILLAVELVSVDGSELSQKTEREKQESKETAVKCGEGEEGEMKREGETADGKANNKFEARDRKDTPFQEVETNFSTRPKRKRCLPRKYLISYEMRDETQIKRRKKNEQKEEPNNETKKSHDSSKYKNKGEKNNSEENDLALPPRLPRGQPYNCNICKKDYRGRQHFLKHYRTHTGEKPHVCIMCSKCFLTSGQLKQHMISHTTERQHECGTCGKTFKNKGGLWEHTKYHTGNFYVCKDCGRCFVRKRELHRHELFHKGETHKIMVECEYCGHYFGPTYIYIHRRTHTGEKPYHCEICGKKFTAKAGLANHQSVHMDYQDKCFICEVCNKRFAKKFELTNHKRAHTAERPFTCEYCAMNLKSKGSLYVHLKQHTGKTYICDICGKAYAAKVGLDVHMRLHTGEAPFECSYCHKRFRHTGHLTEHLRLHTGERPFSCDICGKRFPISGNRNKHMKSAHRIDPQGYGLVTRHRTKKISEKQYVSDEYTKQVDEDDDDTYPELEANFIPDETFGMMPSFSEQL